VYVILQSKVDIPLIKALRLEKISARGYNFPLPKRALKRKYVVMQQ